MQEFQEHQQPLGLSPQNYKFMTESNDRILANISHADRLLAEAETVEEAISVADVADAARVYAKRAGMALPLINKAITIKLRAERKAGEILRGMEKAKNRHSRTNALSGLGITHAQSSRWQRAAVVPEEAFAEYIETANTEGKELTTSGLLKLANAAAPKCGARPARIDGGIITDLDALIQGGQKFGTIYADPPWRYNNQGTRASTGNHYSGDMSVEEICAMPIPDLCADKCHLHLWTTNAFLFECPRIFEAWGFEFKSSFVWVKPQMGIGNYWRNSHEIMLLAIKGGQTALSKGEMSWLECGRGKHSSKPDRVRESIERLSPGPYLELFGRRKIKGWAVFGNQIMEELI
jgi:N6-adenosine-specific RNA methylase IME4